MKHILYIISIIVLIASFYGCANSEKENNKVDENGTSTVRDLTKIVISKEQFEQTGMQLGRLEDHSFSTIVKTTGMVDVPPQNKAIVSAFSGGYIKTTPLLIGDKIKKGQALLTIENPDFITFQRDYLETAEHLTYLKSEYERQKTLVAEKITSQKNFLKAESEYKKALALYNATRKKLTMLNISPSAAERGNITSVATLYAPISGSITKVNVTKGMYVSPADRIMEIIDADHIHLELNIFEKDVMKVKKSQQILFKIPEASTEIFKAEVHLVGTSIDQTNRTVKVHGHLENDSKHNFAIGMFVEASIITDNSSTKALPEEAVVSVEGTNYVLVSATNNNSIFKLKEVTIGKTYEGFIEILNTEAFGSDAEFLTKGAFNLITE
jgi:cobalt-zinc-cadmium efflux system membrane fusion protein